MAQEQFRTKNKKVPNIVNEFDFDDASADRRIDALVKAKNLAETIAESCIDKDAEYDFDGEWIKLNIQRCRRSMMEKRNSTILWLRPSGCSTLSEQIIE